MMVSDWVEVVVEEAAEAAPQGPLSPRGDNGATRFWRTSKSRSAWLGGRFGETCGRWLQLEQ